MKKLMDYEDLPKPIRELVSEGKIREGRIKALLIRINKLLEATEDCRFQDVITFFDYIEDQMDFCSDDVRRKMERGKATLTDLQKTLAFTDFMMDLKAEVGKRLEKNCSCRFNPGSGLREKRIWEEWEVGEIYNPQEWEERYEEERLTKHLMDTLFGE